MGFHPHQSCSTSPAPVLVLSVLLLSYTQAMPEILGNIFFSSFSLFVSINHVVILPLVFSSSFFFGPCVYSLDAQGQALLSWKNDLNGSTQALTSWTATDPNPCGWFGVRCDSHGEVIEISLKSVDLQGILPSNLQPLTSLQGLDMSSANISGVIPKDFRDYKELRFVDLSDNSISWEIPVELCGLKNLQSLSLSLNILEGGIPTEIGNLSSLTYLTLLCAAAPLSFKEHDSPIPKGHHDDIPKFRVPFTSR